MVRSAAFAIVALCAPLVGPSGTQPTTLRIEALSRRPVRVQVSSKPAAILSNDSAASNNRPTIIGVRTRVAALLSLFGR